MANDQKTTAKTFHSIADFAHVTRFCGKIWMRFGRRRRQSRYGMYRMYRMNKTTIRTLRRTVWVSIRGTVRIGIWRTVQIGSRQTVRIGSRGAVQISGRATVRINSIRRNCIIFIFVWLWNTGFWQNRSQILPQNWRNTARLAIWKSQSCINDSIQWRFKIFFDPFKTLRFLNIQYFTPSPPPPKKKKKKKKVSIHVFNFFLINVSNYWFLLKLPVESHSMWCEDDVAAFDDPPLPWAVPKLNGDAEFSCFCWTQIKDINGKFSDEAEIFWFTIFTELNVFSVSFVQSAKAVRNLIIFLSSEKFQKK